MLKCVRPFHLPPQKKKKKKISLVANFTLVYVSGCSHSQERYISNNMS